MCCLGFRQKLSVSLRFSQHFRVSNPGGLRRFYFQKNSTPQNLDMPAWSNLVNFGSNFDQKWPKMFRGRDVCGNFGQAWVRVVVGWGLLIGSEGGLLIGSSRPDPNFGLINPPSCGLGGYQFLIENPILAAEGGFRWAGIINRKWRLIVCFRYRS